MKKHHKYISIILVDIDKLTIINKKYSDAVGDKVLVIVHSIIQKVCKSNYEGRCGDDTFYAVLPDYDIEAAMKMATKLSARIQQYNWDVLAVELKVTCTFSVAQLNREEIVTDWPVRAAQGLKLAKIKGPNQVQRAPHFLPKNQSRNLKDYYS